MSYLGVYCEGCDEDTVLLDNGCCQWCDTQIIIPYRSPGVTYASDDERVAARRQTWRDSKRRLRKIAAICVGCGGDINNQTLGCATCRERHYRRRLRAQEA